MPAEAANNPEYPRARIRPGGVAWRTTFLRRLITQEHQDTSEIRVLHDLSRQGGSLGPLDFFFAETNALYQPLRVRPLDRDDSVLEDVHRATPDASATFDLSALLRALKYRNDARSVLLEARSGAGKTVASIAAMYDCLYAIPSDAGVESPRLAGFLPCPLRRFPKNGSILGAIASASRTGASAERVATWLGHGPPLLLLVDLNGIEPDVRGKVAKGLVEFLDDDASRKAGHLAVVTYRGHAQDETLQTLRDSQGPGRLPMFCRADLEPMDDRAALLYLENLRAVEASLAGREVDRGALLEEQEVVRHLIDRFDVGEGSIVSTPLLLYFVGSLGGRALEEVRTLAGLYDAVAKEFLGREREVRRANPLDEGKVRLAMGRLALAILAQGAGTTRLTIADASPEEMVEEMNAIFSDPASFARYLPKGTKWINEHWLESPYVKDSIGEVLDRKTGQGFGERSFLRWTGSQIGFLHDSFLYYFAACVLRCPASTIRDSPLNSLDETWRSAVVRWWAEDPALWKETAEFLGGMLNADRARELACDLVVARSGHGWPTLLDRVVRNHVPGGDAVLNAIDFAIHHKDGLLEHCPQALFAEVYHYFRDGSGDPAALVDAAEALRARYREPWLRVYAASSPTRWSRPSLYAHRSEVTCVALCPDGRVVSGDDSGEVILWDPRRRKSRTLYRHDKLYRHDRRIFRVTFRDDGQFVRLLDGRIVEFPGDRVSSLAVSGDGRVIVSGGWDNAVRRAIDGAADTEPLYVHDDWVNSIAISGDGRVVVSGGRDKTVRCAVDGVAKPEPLYRHGGSVAVSADGRVIISGGCTEVSLTAEGVAAPEPLILHDRSSTGIYHGSGNGPTIAISADGRVVVSVGLCGDVCRSVDCVVDPDLVFVQDDWIGPIAISGDGRVVVKGSRQNVLRSVDGVADLEPLYMHNGNVNSIAVSADGRVVVSGGEDGTVRRAIDGRADHQGLYTHNGVVNSVAVSADGRVVVSGGKDKTVRCQVDGQGDPDPHHYTASTTSPVFVSGDGDVFVAADRGNAVLRMVAGQRDRGPLHVHKNGVCSLAVSDNGRVIVSGDLGGALHRAVDGRAHPAPFHVHKISVKSVAISGDGRIVVSFGAAGDTHLSVDGYTEPTPPHLNGLNPLAVSGDGRIIVGGKGGAVRRAVDGRADPEPLYWHDGFMGLASITVSADGRVVVSGGTYGDVRRAVVAVPDLEPLYRHRSRVNSVSVSGDGRIVVSGGDDMTIRVYVDGRGLVSGLAEIAPIKHVSMASRAPVLLARLANSRVLCIRIENLPEDYFSGLGRTDRRGPTWLRPFRWLARLLGRVRF